MVFPEQENQCESSTAYETNGPTGPAGVRHRLTNSLSPNIANTGAVVSVGLQTSGSTIGGVSGHAESVGGLDAIAGAGGDQGDHAVLSRGA